MAWDGDTDVTNLLSQPPLRVADQASADQVLSHHVMSLVAADSTFTQDRSDTKCFRTAPRAAIRPWEFLIS